MATIDATVFGAGGFVGGRIAARLRAQGAVVWTPDRADVAAGRDAGRDLGDVIYAIGLTGDFRSRFAETVEAHAGLLARMLDRSRWRSWLFLSSTRLYGGCAGDRPCAEDDPLPVRPSADAVYDLSKLLGEALCLGRPEPTCRVARLSNVFGPGLGPAAFLGALAREAEAAGEGGRVTLREDPSSAKDYMPLDAAAALLVAIALDGRERLYNVASGVSVAHAAVARLLTEVRGVAVDFAPGAPLRRFPPIDPRRAQTEFGAPTPPVGAEMRRFFAAPNRDDGDRP